MAPSGSEQPCMKLMARRGGNAAKFTETANILNAKAKPVQLKTKMHSAFALLYQITMRTGTPL